MRETTDVSVVCLVAFVALCILCALTAGSAGSGCNTLTTRVTAPDGTVTETTQQTWSVETLAALEPGLLESLKLGLQAELAHQEALTAQQIAAKQQRLQMVLDVLAKKKAK